MGLLGKIFHGIKKVVTAPFKLAAKVIDFTVIKPLKFVGGLIAKIIGNPVTGTILGMLAGGLLGIALAPATGGASLLLFGMMGAQLGGTIGGLVGGYIQTQRQQAEIMKYMKMQQASMMQDQVILQQMMAQYGGYGTAGLMMV